tara:strand:+ start:3632 stop:6763 length:3132 start_codon:yes stop_codon:yes gene_type:complete
MKIQNFILIIISLNLLLSQSSAELYKKNSPATVRIDAIVPDDIVGNDGGCGTGFIIDQMGIIVTNHHVIDGAKSVTVELESGIKYEVQGFYYVDERLDIAIMKIPAFGLPYVQLGNSNYIEELEEIFTIGNPLCIADEYSKNTASIGNISQRYTDDDGIDWIKHTAPISSGNSGGPLFNMSGEVIGINTQVWTGDAQNLNLAVPINYVRGYVESGLLYANIAVDYDYVSDSWDRYYPEQLNDCNDFEWSDQQCECIFNVKMKNFDHWNYVQYTDEFIDIVDNECFSSTTTTNNSNNKVKNYTKYGCIQGDCYNGWSKYVYEPDDEVAADIYEGQYVDGIRNGYGIYSWAGDWLGQKYIGEYDDWDRNGYGIFIYRNGEAEAGIYRNNEIEEYLSLIEVEDYLKNKYKDYHVNPLIEYGCVKGNCHDEWSTFIYGIGEFEGDTYEGDYKDGSRSGYGSYTWAGEWLGQKYVGEYDDWERNGYGVFTYRSGDIESGIFKDGELSKNLSVNEVEDYLNDKYFLENKNNDYGCIQGDCYNGWGEYIWDGEYDGDNYIGEWKDGLKHGNGVYTWGDSGSQYSGEFYDDNGEGYGTYKWGGEWLGQEYRGEWDDFEYSGYGIFTYRNGDVESGIYRNGELNRKLSLETVESYLTETYSLKQWYDIENEFMVDCSEDESNDYCKKFWDCSYPYLINKYKNTNAIDWSDDSYFDFINNKCDNMSQKESRVVDNSYQFSPTVNYTYDESEYWSEDKKNSYFVFAEKNYNNTQQGNFGHCSSAYNLGWTYYYGVGVDRDLIAAADLFEEGLACSSNYYASDVMQKRIIQTSLNILGYNCGKVDGVPGKNTKRAIESFMSDNGLYTDNIDYNYENNSNNIEYLLIKSAQMILTGYSRIEVKDFINSRSYDGSNNSFNEEYYKKYFDDNYKYLDAIEGVWKVSASLINSVGVVVEKNDNFASAIIVKSDSDDYDFYEYIGNDSNDDWTPGSIGAYFNKTNNPYIYKSFQLNQRGEKTHEYMRDYRLLDNELFFKEVMDEEGNYSVHSYKKIYPVK